MAGGHHPAEDTLALFAAGRLGAARATVVAAHLESCPACRAGVALAEAVGGDLLATLPATPLGPDAQAHLLARLERPVPAEPARTAPPHPVWLAPDVALAAPVRQALAGARRWRRIVPGVRIARLIRRDEAGGRLDLIGVAPGAGLPQHGHRGAEMTLVLAGAFRDLTGRYGPGDVADLDGTIEHSPTVEPGRECVCLIATEGRLRMQHWAARLLQPLIGF